MSSGEQGPASTPVVERQQRAVSRNGYSWPALRYTCTLFSKAAGTLPATISGNTQREYLGFFLASGSDPVQLTPTLGDPGSGITLTSTLTFFELRKSSHGPLVQEGWTGLEGGAGSQLTVIEVIPDGD